MTRTRASTAPLNAMLPHLPTVPTGGLISQIPDIQTSNGDWFSGPSQNQLHTSTTDTNHDTTNGGSNAARHGLPMIKFLPHKERNGRPSLEFTTLSRILPVTESIIRVGRYSERENQPEASSNAPSDAPIGFKSKVVSRRHCEFSWTNGQWFIKDVKSSSGTFLNHIRLSQPGVESRLYPVNDGDIVQLGIDFKGGEEMIFRCVKIRIECNRGWQKSINKFNKSTYRKLRELSRTSKAVDGGSESKDATECTICLNSIAPCQALFVAPCSHAWHYKCIKPMLDDLDPHHPQLLCPNCRARADLDADVDNPIDFEDSTDDESSPPGKGDEVTGIKNGLDIGSTSNSGTSRSQGSRVASPMDLDPDISQVDREADQLAWALSGVSVDHTFTGRPRDGSGSSSLNPSASSFIPGPPAPSPRFPVRGVSQTDSTPFLDRTLVGNISEALHGSMDVASSPSDGRSSTGAVQASMPRPIPPVTTILSPRTLTPPSRGDHVEGLMTPRNTAGPFVFDGGAGNEGPAL